MIGIYKITSPKGRVYIGQSVDVEKREVDYMHLRNCKAQTKLYRSLVKYGVFNHIFEIVEQCTITQLNERERYWQDFYNVLEEGLNCRLTTTRSKSGKVSEESIRKRVANTNYEVLQKKRAINTNYSRRTSNTDYKKRTQNTDYTSFQERKVANTDYSAIAKKNSKPIRQYTKQGTFVRDWESTKQAGESLGIQRTDITQCCKGRNKSAGGFIWKYK
jgi:group I intron endonuclease